MGAFQSRTYKPPSGTVADFRFNFAPKHFQTGYNVAVSKYKGDALVKSGLTNESMDIITSLISNTIEECDTYSSVAANHKKLNICIGILATVLVGTVMGCMTFDLVDKYPFVIIPFVSCCILFSMIFFHLLIIKLNCQISILSVEFVDKMTKEKYTKWKQEYPNANIELNLIGPIFIRNQNTNQTSPSIININDKKRLTKLKKSLQSRAESTLKLAQIWVYLRLTLVNKKATVLKQKNETLFSTTFGLPKFSPVKLPTPPRSRVSVRQDKLDKQNRHRYIQKQVQAQTQAQVELQAVQVQVQSQGKAQSPNVDPEISDKDDDEYLEYSNSSTCTHTGHGYPAHSHIVASNAVMIEDMEGEIIQVASRDGGAILVPVALDADGNARGAGMTESEAETEATDMENTHTEPSEMVIENMQGETIEKGLKIPYDPNGTEYEIIIL